MLCLFGPFSFSSWASCFSRLRVATDWGNTGEVDARRRRKRRLAQWWELRLVYSRSFLRSHSDWPPRASTADGKYCLMRRTRLERHTCAQACFPSVASKFAACFETTSVLV